MSKDDKSLTKSNTNGTAMSVPGSFLPAEFAEFIGDGFASIQTVMIGEPADGKLPFYLGKLIGPGEPIEMEDGKRAMPTWAFNPAIKLPDGRVGFADNVTQVVPASYMLNAHCGRIYKEAEKRKMRAVVGVQYKGKTKTRKGLALNDLDVFEKYVVS